MELTKLDTDYSKKIKSPYSIIDKLSLYDPRLKKDVISNAIDFSKERHKEQKRDSGDPYFFHPLAVANILVDFKLDWICVTAALLHDTVEDGVATRAEIENYSERK